MRIVFFGPPGVGKGTQARLLVDKHGLAHISTGDLIREAIRANHPVGLEAKGYVDAGRLAPDHLVRRLAEDAIAEHDFDRFILDGYPRTVRQAEWLSTFLRDNDALLHAVISLQVPDDNIVRRLSQRRVHKVTGETYHLEFKPPGPDVDPACIVQRPDDLPEAIRARLLVYREQTQPLETFYGERENYFPIDGVGEIEEVHERIEEALRPFVIAA